MSNIHKLIRTDKSALRSAQFNRALTEFFTIQLGKEFFLLKLNIALTKTDTALVSHKSASSPPALGEKSLTLLSRKFFFLI